MRILVVHNRYRSASPSGENRVVDQETAALEGAGHEVRHFERSSDDIDSLSLARRALVPGQVLWSQSASREISRILGDFRPDVVHVHNLFPMISPSVLRACRRHLVPAVATFHNYRPMCASGDFFRNGSVCHDCVGRLPVPAVVHGCYRDSVTATLPLAAGITAHKQIWQTHLSAYMFISDAQRQLYASLDLPSERCFVKYNLVYPMEGTAHPEPIVVYIGRLTELKGLQFLMDAWDRFPAKNLKLVIAGSGPMEDEVQRWAASRDAVEFAGFLSRDQCAGLLKRARAVVVPSIWEEPFGLVVAEAMSASVPPIAPGHGAFPELISDGVDGVIYPSGDRDALARLFGEIEREPARFSELGQKARLTYEQRFHPDCNVKQLESVYRYACEHPVWIAQDQNVESKVAVGTK
ncbi:MAG: glycosyltransferase [Acidimicrobiales bacterium]